MPSTTETSILYGPFPLRVGRLFVALVALFLAVVLGAVALETQHLQCEFGARGMCSVHSVVSRRADWTFASEDLQQVQMETVRRGKGKGTEYGVVVLTVAGREQRLLAVDPDQARDVVQKIEAGIALRSAFRVSVTGPRWLLLLSAACSSLALSMAWTAVRRMGALQLTLERDGSLRIERRVLGVPLRVRALSLHGVTEVELEWSHESDFWKGRSETPRTTARIVVVTSQGRLPVTQEYWPGQTVHLRAAAELRRGFGLLPGSLESELHVLASSRVTPALAQTRGGRVALVWTALCCGSLVGLAVFGVVGLSLGRLQMNEGIEPWMLLVGCGGGAIAALALMRHLTRPRPPR